MDEALRVHPGGRAEGHEVGGACAGVAERPLADRGAERVEERVANGEPVEDPFGAQVAVGKDRLAAVAVDDRSNRSLISSSACVPGDPFEAAFPFRPDASQGVEHAVGAVGVVRVVVDLDAQAAPGEGMVGVSSHLGGPAVLDGDQHRTGVRTIVGAGASHDPKFIGDTHQSLPSSNGGGDSTVPVEQLKCRRS